MALNYNTISANNLENRSQLIKIESELLSINIDSSIAGKLISLGTNSSPTKAFAKLYGYVNINEKALYIKDFIALPVLQEEEIKTMEEVEASEAEIKRGLGYDYNQVGLFLITENEGYQNEDLLYTLCGFNLPSGFNILVVFSKEKAKFKNVNPLECYTFSEEANEVYEFKEQREIFEPNLKKLENMIRENKPILEKKILKVNPSPILELIVAQKKSELLKNNPINKEISESTLLSSNLDNALSNHGNYLYQVLLNKKNHDLKRNNLLNFNGAVHQTNELLNMKRKKIKEIERKLKLLENINN